MHDRLLVRERLDALAGATPLLSVDGLVAGYGTTEVLHGVDLRVGKGQALCIIGPNGAGKSTILHSIFGLTDIREGRIVVGGGDVTRLLTNARLRDALRSFRDVRSEHERNDLLLAAACRLGYADRRTVS